MKCVFKINVITTGYKLEKEEKFNSSKSYCKLYLINLLLKKEKYCYAHIVAKGTVFVKSPVLYTPV